MKHSHQPLFPIPVGFYDFGSKLTDKEKDFIKSLERGPNQGNTTSLNRYILKEKKLLRLNKFFHEALNHYFAEIYKPKYDVQLKVTQCWANFNEKGQWHHTHAHPNSFLSGVFYVQADQDTDKIFFKKNNYNAIEIPHDPENWNMFNTDSWWFPCIEGQLIIFPSSLTHEVPMTQVDTTRISISMNSFPIGIIGDFNTLTELIVQDVNEKGKK